MIAQKNKQKNFLKNMFEDSIQNNKGILMGFSSGNKTEISHNYRNGIRFQQIKRNVEIFASLTEHN